MPESDEVVLEIKTYAKLLKRVETLEKQRGEDRREIERLLQRVAEMETRSEYQYRVDSIERLVERLMERILSETRPRGGN